MITRDGAVKNQSLTLGEERKVTTPSPIDVDSKAGLDGGPTQCTNAPPQAPPGLERGRSDCGWVNEY